MIKVNNTLDHMIQTGKALTFFNKTNAQMTAEQYGYRRKDVLHVKRRFEKVWMIGKAVEKNNYLIFTGNGEFNLKT